MQADVLKMPEDKARCIAAGLLLENVYKKFRTEKLKELANANSFEYTQKPEERKVCLRNCRRSGRGSAENRNLFFRKG